MGATTPHSDPDKGSQEGIPSGVGADPSVNSDPPLKQDAKIKLSNLDFLFQRPILAAVIFVFVLTYVMLDSAYNPGGYGRRHRKTLFDLIPSAPVVTQVPPQPTDVSDIVRQADESRASGDLAKAIDLYSKAIAIDPQSNRAIFGQGLAFEKVANWSEAATSFLQYRRRFGSTELGEFHRALANQQLGRLNEAIEAYGAAISLASPGSETLPYSLSNRGLAFVGIAKPELAIMDYDAAISINKSDPALFIGRGGANLMLERMSEAKSDIEFALDLDPSNTTAKQYLEVVKQAMAESAMTAH